MKKLIFSFLLPAAIFSGLASCGKKATGSFPTLDVTASYPEKELILQDIATVEYIPLETGDDFLLDDNVTIRYMDDDIVVSL